MSKQNIEIEVPEGFEAKYNPETMKVELVKKDDKPRTWEEFCENYPVKKEESWVTNSSGIEKRSFFIKRNAEYDKNLCMDKSEAEAFLALMQLEQVRRAWIGVWKPDWSSKNLKYCIINLYNTEIIVDTYTHQSRSLSFPTREMAEEFLTCFKDLIKKAKILL